MSARAVSLGAIGLALVLRLAFGLGYWVGKPLTNDELEYLFLAENIAEGRGLTYGTAPLRPGADPLIQRFSRPPLYPLFLASIYRTVGWLGEPLPSSVPTSIKVVQAFVGALTVWLIGLVALRCVGPRARASATVLAAVYPPLIWICAYALTEALYAALAVGSAALLGRVIDRETDTPVHAALILFVAGCVTGLAALTRSAMLFLPLIAGCYLLARRRFAWSAAFALGVVLVIGPWTGRNAVVHHRLMLIAADGGLNFWVGNHPLSPGEGDMAANPSIKRQNLAFRARHPTLSAEELDPLYYQDAFRAIVERPWWWLGLMARKVFYLVVPIGPSYRLHSSLYLWASALSYGLLVPCGVWGAVRLYRSRSYPVALWLLAASAVMACIVFMPQERYRIPIIDPTLIVCAAALVEHNTWRDR